MLAETLRRRPTFDELYRRIEALPQGITGQILEAGVLTTMSRPAVGHEVAIQGIEEAIRGFSKLRGGAGWWILGEMEIRFPGDRLAVPDLAGWRVERVPELPRENPLVVLPDWVCEVLSPSTAKVDRMLKLPLYAEAGVRWTWLVDPELHTLEVFEAVDGRAVRTAGARDEEQRLLAPFEAEVRLAGLWQAAPQSIST